MTSKLPYTQPVKAGGKTYWYYRRYGKRVRLRGRPGSRQFMLDYAAAHAANTKTDTTDTFHAVAHRYMQSPKFKRTTKGTQDLYRRAYNRVGEKLGDYRMVDIRRKHLLAIQDKLSDQPATANSVMGALRVLFAWAYDREIIPINHATKIEHLKTGEYQPWPETAIDQFLEVAEPDIKRLFLFGLLTGQRFSDCLKARWSDISDGYLHVKQGKTKEDVAIPLYPALQELLNTTPKRGLMILTTKTGRPWSYQNAQHYFRMTKNEAGIPLVFHGLRKTAAVILAEAGCSDREIGAITGHQSTAMIAHYTKGTKQKRLADAAIAKLANVAKNGCK